MEEEVLPWILSYEDLQSLVAVPSRTLPEKKGFPWADLKISHLEKSLVSSIQSLYQDVTTGHSRDESCLADFFTSLAASQVFQDLWAGESRGPFLLPAPFARNLLTLEEIQHGFGAPTGRKPFESALTLTDGVDFRCPISVPPIRQLPHMLEVLPLVCISYCFQFSSEVHCK